jgi:hypothetical protein
MAVTDLQSADAIVRAIVGQTTVIGTVAPGVAGDTLTLKESTGSGTLSLGPVQSGTRQVIYTAPASISASTIDAVSYQVTDQQDGQSATGSANVQLDAGPSITAVAPSAAQAGQSTEIATVTRGLPGDTLSLNQTGSVGGGTVSLKLVNGNYEVIFTAPAKLQSSPITYSITDQHNDAVANGTAFIGGNTNQSVTATGDTAVILGNGNDSVTLGGTANAVFLGNGNDTVTTSIGGNTISLGTGNDTVSGGADDVIRLTGNSRFTLSGTAEMVFLGTGNENVTDDGYGTALNIGPTAIKGVLANFGADLNQGVVHLLGGIGGYTTAQQAYNSLRSDGHGGSLLSVGNTSLDITNVPIAQLGLNNFHIG